MHLIIFLSLVIFIADPVLADEESTKLFPATMPEFVDDALRYLEFDSAHEKELLNGKVLFTGMPEMEILDEQLAVVGVMLIINRPMGSVVDMILSGASFRANSKLIEYALISETMAMIDEATEKFLGIHFTNMEINEVDSLMRAVPGGDFNFSAEEFKRFRMLEKDVDNRIDAVSGVYREILLNRYASYLQQGVSGIADYQRKGRLSSPSQALSVSVESAWFLEKHFPDFHHAIQSFPEQDREDIVHRFYWLKQITSDRPNLVLSHHMIQKKEEYAIALDQQYYSGHSFNAMHTVVGLVPVDDSTLILASNRIFTDKILGFASRQKRKRGRKIVAALMTQRFSNLKKLLEKE